MSIKRNKPRLDTTVDQDVYDWITAAAEKRRLKVSQYLNMLLAERMQAETQAGQPGEARDPPPGTTVYPTARASPRPLQAAFLSWNFGSVL